MKYLYSALVLTIAVTCIAIFSRPILPIDETRYVGVAWESFHSGDFLVSHMNGSTYAHKPPLLFWIIGAIWSLTGVTEFGARVAGPVAGLLCLPLIRWLSLRLWPDDQRAANCSPLILATYVPWLLFAPLTMFDALLTLTTLIALSGVVKAAQGQAVVGWLIAGIGMGLGILSKGPVVFVHIVPTALMGVWWTRHITQVEASVASNSMEQVATNRPTTAGWYAGVLAAIVIAAAIGLGWAIPSAIAGGKAYAEELLLGQTAGRVVKSFSHRHHVLWYLPLLPVCTLPWLILGTVWRGMRELRLDGGVRFVTCWIVGSMVILSLISGKQVHYLMPVFPAIALFFGRLLSVAPSGVLAKDLRFLAVGTMAVACLPLLFNHIPAFQNLGLAGIVPDLFTPLMAGCGGLLFFVNRDRTEGSVLGVSMLTATNICLVVVAGSINFWQGFNVEGLAQYAAASRRPIAWYGEYHAQLNFAGRLDHLEVARSGDDLRAWMESNPQGLVIFKLASEGKAWSEFLMISAEEPKATELGQVPNSAQRALIDQMLAEKVEFADLENKPQPELIFWIRNGLKRKPFVILSQDRYQQPDEVKQLASDAQLDRL